MSKHLQNSLNAFLFLLSLCCFSLTTQLQGKIIEFDSFEQLPEHLDSTTFLLLDIDNTLTHPAQMLGGDPWFCHCLKTKVREGQPYNEALYEVLQKWMSIQQASQMVTLEPCTAAIIAKVQKLGIPVIGFTTRSPGFSDCTVAQLKSLGIDLTLASPTQNNHLFDNEAHVLFHQGILFTNNTHKGEALLKFLELAKLPLPKRVVFVNDKVSHITPVEEVCEKLNIPVLGLRYRPSDLFVDNFDPIIAQIQLSSFGTILSDDEARARLQSTEDKAQPSLPTQELISPKPLTP